MLDRKRLQALGCWTGYKLDRVVLPEGDSRTLSLYLKATSKVMYCQECGAKCNQIHECDRCGGPRLERLDWLGRYQIVCAAT
ncbi:transposase [Herbaspirillum rubrisubalbicans]|nr:transposase [Herbaspirillum rubrisubalbicans]